MTVRIGAGALKGRKVKASRAASRHGELRPTSAKVRESLFNILGGKISGAVFVDLYAGTGAVGMEAMSRGAGTVYFVEADRRRAAAIEQSLSGCGCRARAVIVNSGAKAFLGSSAREGRAFDIVFLDPPYASGEAEGLLEALAGGQVLRSGALVIAEHRSGLRLPEEAGVLKKKKTYKYGDTSLTVMVKG